MAVKVQLNRLEETVLEYEKEPIEEGKILFIGSSGFTRWSKKYGNKPLEECILGKNGDKVAVNHGFGGSTMEEALYYYPRLVRPWKPRAIVLTTFINDRGFLYTPDELMLLMERFFEYARVDMPGIKLYVTDIRPHAKIFDDEARRLWLNHVYAMNQRLKEYADSHDDVTLIRVSQEPMYFKEGAVGDYTQVREDIFIEDRIHFTPYGYELFTDVMRRALDDIL